MSKSSTTTESGILDEIVGSGEPSFSPEAARSILELRFSDRAIQRMRDLLDRNNQKVLPSNEQTRRLVAGSTAGEGESVVDEAFERLERDLNLRNNPSVNQRRLKATKTDSLQLTTNLP